MTQKKFCSLNSRIFFWKSLCGLILRRLLRVSKFHCDISLRTVLFCGISSYVDTVHTHTFCTFLAEKNHYLSPYLRAFLGFHLLTIDFCGFLPQITLFVRECKLVVRFVNQTMYTGRCAILVWQRRCRPDSDTNTRTHLHQLKPLFRAGAFKTGLLQRTHRGRCDGAYCPFLIAFFSFTLSFRGVLLHFPIAFFRCVSIASVQINKCERDSGWLSIYQHKYD